jgi:hypothetical protein
MSVSLYVFRSSQLPVHGHELGLGAVEIAVAKRFDPFAAFLVLACIGLAVVDASGVKSTIGFGEGESKTILLVYSATCPACQETIPRWKALLGATPPGAVRILGLEKEHRNPATSAAALVVPALPFPTYTAERSGMELAKKLPFVPATVILDDKGVVTRAWFGVPNQEEEAELLRVIAQ